MQLSRFKAIITANQSSFMASINSLATPQSFHPLSKLISKTTKQQPFSSLKHRPSSNPTTTTTINRPPHQLISRTNQIPNSIVGSVAKELDIIPVQSIDGVDQQQDCIGNESERCGLDERVANQVVGGFGNNELEGRLYCDGAAAGYASSSSSSGKDGDGGNEEENMERFINRAINATIVLASGTFAITKLLTIDHDYWHGWTTYEILRFAPQHNWSAYQEALKTNPVFAKMVISGVVYSLGDWIAQCFEGKLLFEFDRARMFRSGLVGFTLHGSISHYYYQFCEELFPFDDWWVVPAKVVFDQTFWAAVWNSIYYLVLGVLRLQSPLSIHSELKATFWPMLTAGWKLWPFAHLITYGMIPVEQRLLWVDCIELIWVTILSTYSNEKSGARISEASVEQPPSCHQ